MNILFVCTGNTCRSPMAEAIYNHEKVGGPKAISAGIYAAEGSPASPLVLKILGEKGIAINHHSKQVQEKDVALADYIFTMTTGHKRVLMESFPGASDKIFTLKEYVCEGIEDQDIIDPFGGTEEIYRVTYEEITQLVQLLKEKLSQQ